MFFTCCVAAGGGAFLTAFVPDKMIIAIIATVSAVSAAATFFAPPHLKSADFFRAMARLSRDNAQGHATTHAKIDTQEEKILQGVEALLKAQLINKKSFGRPGPGCPGGGR